VSLGARATTTGLTLAAGELVFVTKRDGGTCTVLIPHLKPAADDAPFTVDCDRLEATQARSAY
jgi:hypothetical protein